MGILQTVKSRFEHSEKQSVTIVKIKDPLQEALAKSCFNLYKNLNGNELEHVNIRIKASGIYYRICSYIFDNFNSDNFVESILKEDAELKLMSSQYESAERHAIAMSGALELMIERGINYKKESVENHIELLSSVPSLYLIPRGHKWRTLDYFGEQKHFKNVDSLTLAFA